MNKRILFKDNSTLIDFSPELNNYRTGSKTFNYVASQDALYIGSRFPFNHLYFKLSSVNSVSAIMSVQYYSDGWRDVVELIDETNAFSQSGFITFTPDKEDGWVREDTEDIAELNSKIIYNLYWLKITFDQTLTNTTAISWVGNLFSDDYDLEAEFPDLTRPQNKTAFQTGKTNYQEQHVRAAEILVKDLSDRGIIEDSGQILNREDFKSASVMKVAEIIFSAMGDDYNDQRIVAREEYGLRLGRKVARVDLNNNAIEDIYEMKNKTGFLSR